MSLDPDLEVRLKRLKRDAEGFTDLVSGYETTSRFIGNYQQIEGLAMKVYNYACDVANNQQRNVGVRRSLESSLLRARRELIESYNYWKKRQREREREQE